MCTHALNSLYSIQCTTNKRSGRSNSPDPEPNFSALFAPIPRHERQLSLCDTLVCEAKFGLTLDLRGVVCVRPAALIWYANAIPTRSSSQIFDLSKKRTKMECNAGSLVGNRSPNFPKLNIPKRCCGKRFSRSGCPKRAVTGSGRARGRARGRSPLLHVLGTRF